METSITSGLASASFSSAGRKSVWPNCVGSCARIVPPASGKYFMKSSRPAMPAASFSNRIAACFLPSPIRYLEMTLTSSPIVGSVLTR